LPRPPIGHVSRTPSHARVSLTVRSVALGICAGVHSAQRPFVKRTSPHIWLLLVSGHPGEAAAAPDEAAPA
jgi:hypothetical protein